jgi:hypothetical protein
MYGLIFLLSFCFTLPVQALSQLGQVQIHDIDLGSQLTDEPLVLLTDGRVLKLDRVDLGLIQQFQLARQTEQRLDLLVNQRREVLAITGQSTPKHQFIPSHAPQLNELSYQPSVLGSMEHAQRYHRQARRSREGETQCFNRAHVWSYDWWKNNNFYSMKMFIFFTRKYIRQYNFEWWFHVAPYVHVNVEGKIRERMMDMKYTRGPVTVKQWSDIFVKNKADCLIVQRYSDYANYPETGDCYLYRTPMYYYQPVDMEMEEIWGTGKPHWVDWEVREAYREAFGVSI